MIKEKVRFTICLILTLSLAWLFILQIHNINSFPVKRGFDAGGHIAYINYLKTFKRVPLANEGWETYQPPLYYVLGSVFNKIEDVRVLGIISYILLIFSVLILIQHIGKNFILSLCLANLAGSLPVVIYLVPPISNEFFSSVVIGITLVWYIMNKNRNTLTSNIFLGVLLGLSILAKATAWILVTTLTLDILVEFWHKKYRKIESIIVPMSIMLLIGGWFYFRDIVMFRNPFISPFDFPQFKIWQPPGQRDIHFFTDLSAFINFDLFKAHFYSLWAGTYFSWFFDGHNVIIPVQPFSKIGIVLILFSLLLIIAFIYGYITETRHITSVNRVFIVYPFLLFISYIIYNLKMPFYSTVKGAFLISALIPFIFFIAKSLQKLNGYYWIIALYTIIYLILISKAFWILPWWYNR